MSFYVLFPPKKHSLNLSMRKPSCKSQLKDILQDILPIFLKTPKFIKNKESLRSFNNQGKPKNTLLPNVMWYCGQNSEQKKEHWLKICEDLNKIYTF